MESNASIRTLKILNILAFAGTVVVNGLATTLPINGMGTGELSDLYPNLFVPSGITFSIWGVIYLLLLAFAVFQATKRGSEAARKIGPLFIYSSAANIGWIFAWHYKLVGLSFIIMIVLLGALIRIYLRLGIGLSGAKRPIRTGRGVTWFVCLPFSIYLGWITVATIANATALLVNAGWNGFGAAESFWTIFVIAAALVITILMLVTRRDAAYSLVVIWALLGILIKRAFEDPSPVLSVVIAAAAAGVLIIIAIPVVLILRRGK